MNYSLEKSTTSFTERQLIMSSLMKRTINQVICLALVLYSLTTNLYSQTVTSLQPRSIRPGQTASLRLVGADLTEAIRIKSVDTSIEFELEGCQPTEAVFAISTSDEIKPGPVPLWISLGNGTIQQQTVFIDDLEAVEDSGQNHSIETAQQIRSGVTVAGVCDASLSDYYRIHATAGQRIAIEVHTQSLHSQMDPVVRLIDAAGETLRLEDDQGLGPDCRFSHTFETEGDYLLGIHDSRYAAGGSSYQLRVGDFPIIQQAYPLTVQFGSLATIHFKEQGGHDLPSAELTVVSDSNATMKVASKFTDGTASGWISLQCFDYPQLLETQAEEPLALPVGINGRLQEPGEIDAYVIKGVKGQVVRIEGKSGSLGSPTLLQIECRDSAGTKIAETKISEKDEWSVDVTLPSDGDYQVRVSDLLKRGGTAFAYSLQCVPQGTFNVALKADAKTREHFLMETKQGACSLDLQINRFGYDGEIELAIVGPESKLRILNPRIPSGAAEAKILLAVSESWAANSLQVLQIEATSVANPKQRCLVDTHALHRVKEPHVIHPMRSANGVISAAGAEPGPTFFAMQAVEPVRFARPVTSHVARLSVKKIDEKFKAAVQLAAADLQPDWSVISSLEKEEYSLTFQRLDSDLFPEHLDVPFYGEFNGHGRLEFLSMEIDWFNPIELEVEFSEPLVQGGDVAVDLTIVREGDEPHPVSVTFSDLPAGVSVPDVLEIPADQNQIRFDLQLDESVDLSVLHQIVIHAASQFGGQDFTVAAEVQLPKLIAQPQSLSTYPKAISLLHARDRQQVVITGTNADETTRDWTRFAGLQIDDPAVAEIRGGVVYPLSDGQTQLVAKVGGKISTVPIQVTGASKPRPVEFESEVLVALSKQGCNSGACHGSPSGKGGFRLSLRAFDKKLDELTLIREDFGRRINPVEGSRSLLILKPLMQVAHGGGKQLRKTDAAYSVLENWINEGAGTDATGTPRIERLEIFPSEKRILHLKDGGQQLAVIAVNAAGERRDVTHLAAYQTSDTSVASVDVHGLVTPVARGEVAILVRVLEYIESVPLMFIEQREDFRWQSPTPNNFVDELVNAKLQQLNYLPSETCSDDEFLRRVSLDLLGVLPNLQETKQFLENPAADKRERMIDSLLERREFAKFWALKWGDLLKMTRKLVGDEGVFKYHRWVEQSLHENMPYDEFTRQLLTSVGSTFSNPPANFYRTATDMNECVETISQVFLGSRLQCAKCHNHPFERWTQDNYYGLGAFFNRVQRRKTPRPGEMFIYSSDTGEVTQPRTGERSIPWLPQTGTIEVPENSDRREAFAAWLVQPENPYFARIEVNRIWSQFFSRGIVEPIDDFRDSNPPTNAALLNALADDFVESGYDRKQLIRKILNSRTYQASYRTNQFNQEDTKYFSHQEPRLLGAEQILDAINRTLDLKQKFGSLPAGTLATQLPAPDLVSDAFLKVFGQPERSTVCACERASDSNLGMAIELFNGPMIHQKLKAENNRFRKALSSGVAIEEVLKDLYLAAVSRPPSEVEMKAALDHCSKNSDVVIGVEDICWAIFNTDEFLFQH